jgi:hypothetical protein
MFWAQQPLRIDDVHSHLSRVGTLKIPFYSYSYGDRNYASIHLLQCCRSTRCLEVSLKEVEVCRMYSCPVFSFFCSIIHALDFVLRIYSQLKFSTSPSEVGFF